MNNRSMVWVLGSIGLVMAGVATGCAQAPEAPEATGESTSHQKKSKDESKVNETTTAYKDECSLWSYLNYVAGTATGAFYCATEAGELAAGCIVGGAISLGSTCVAAVGAVAYEELEPGPVPSCKDLPENLNGTFGFACQQQEADRAQSTSADDLDAQCKNGSLSGAKSFCGRSDGSQNTLYNCVDGQWNQIEVCEMGCQMNGFGDDVCKFM